MTIHPRSNNGKWLTGCSTNFLYTSLTNFVSMSFANKSLLMELLLGNKTIYYIVYFPRWGHVKICLNVPFVERQLYQDQLTYLSKKIKMSSITLSLCTNFPTLRDLEMQSQTWYNTLFPCHLITVWCNSFFINNNACKTNLQNQPTNWYKPSDQESSHIYKSLFSHQNYCINPFPTLEKRSEHFLPCKKLFK